MTSVLHGSRARRESATATMTRPTGMAMVGFLTVLTGAWAGIVAFVGPVWGYNAAGTTSWAWNANHWLLHLIPGAVGVVAGLFMMARAGSGHRAVTRSGFGLSGLLAAGAGAWLILGPAVWPMIYSGPVYGPATDHMAAFLNALGANLGPGILLVLFGGMALKSVVRDREVAVPAAGGVAAERAAVGRGGAAPVDTGRGASGAAGPEPAWTEPSGTASGAAGREPAWAAAPGTSESEATPAAPVSGRMEEGQAGPGPVARMEEGQAGPGPVGRMEEGQAAPGPARGPAGLMDEGRVAPGAEAERPPQS